jgi:hypothetical protein
VVEQMTQAERDALMARLLEQHPQLITFVAERLREVE